MCKQGMINTKFISNWKIKHSVQKDASLTVVYCKLMSESPLQISLAGIVRVREYETTSAVPIKVCEYISMSKPH